MDWRLFKVRNTLENVPVFFQCVGAPAREGISEGLSDTNGCKGCFCQGHLDNDRRLCIPVTASCFGVGFLQRKEFSSCLHKSFHSSDCSPYPLDLHQFSHHITPFLSEGWTEVAISDTKGFIYHLFPWFQHYCTRAACKTALQNC